MGRRLVRLFVELLAVARVARGARSWHVCSADVDDGKVMRGWRSFLISSEISSVMVTTVGMHDWIRWFATPQLSIVCVQSYKHSSRALASQNSHHTRIQKVLVASSRAFRVAQQLRKAPLLL